MPNDEIKTSKESNQVIANILIIDDEVRLREAMQKLLNRSGYTVDVAGTLNTAKNLMQNQKYDLLLVDIVLPTTTGLEIIAELQSEFQPFPFFIFITGEPNYQTCLQALRLGASDYLEKPVNKENLITHISSVLQKRSNSKNLTNPTFPLKPPPSKEPTISEEDNLVLQESADNIQNSLIKLKKESGNKFSDDEKEYLNIIAKNITTIRKKLKEFN